jgi:aldose 1-epimerase
MSQPELRLLPVKTAALCHATPIAVKRQHPQGTSVMRTFGSIGEQTIHEIAIASPDGSARAKVIAFGATLRDLEVKRANGQMQRVVLGFETLEDYIKHSPHAGATAGRFANRIKAGRFELDGKSYTLPLNENGRTALHGGGPTGFAKLPWVVTHSDAHSATFAHTSPDGTNGYPGTMLVSCRYQLLDGGALRIVMEATTDAATVVNLAHHSYFNLDGSADILDHTLAIRSNLMTPIDGDLIPNGEMRAVAGTAWDFRTARPIRMMGGDGTRVWYDHNWILRRDRSEACAHPTERIAHAATLASVKSGLTMETWTTEPALQFYDGFKLNVAVPGHGGVRCGANAGLCLEAQHCPDSPNLPHFPSTVLRPGAVYAQVTEYRFKAA